MYVPGFMEIGHMDGDMNLSSSDEDDGKGDNETGGRSSSAEEQTTNSAEPGAKGTMKKGDWVYIGAGEYLKVGSAEHDAHVQRVAELARAAEEERAERVRAKQAAKAAEEEARQNHEAVDSWSDTDSDSD